MNRLDYFHRRQISYKCYPYSDIPTEEKNWGWYYEDGTTQRYRLFPYKGMKITSKKSLYWHLLVIYWLNSSNMREYQTITENDFIDCCKYVCDYSSGFITSNLEDIDYYSVAKSILSSNRKPYNKSVKFVFREGLGLSLSDKMKIISSYTNKSAITESKLSDAIKKIHAKGEVVTNNLLSLELNCSKRTIQRNMNKELVELRKDLNNEVVQQR